MLYKGSSFWQNSLLTIMGEVTKTGKTKSRRWHTDCVFPCVGKTPQCCLFVAGAFGGLFKYSCILSSIAQFWISVRATHRKQWNILFLPRPINKPTSYFEGQVQSWTSCNFPPSMLSHRYARTGVLAQDRNVGQPLCLVFCKKWFY